MINGAFFLALLFIFLRLTTFLAIVPVFFPTGTPNHLKIGLGLILSFMVIPGVDYVTVAKISNNLDIVMLAMNEIITGLVLGYIVTLVFDMIKMAGNLMDMQIGLAMASMFDPTTKSTATLVERLVYWISIIIFFIVDGHHILLKSIMESYEVVSLGKTVIFDSTLMLMLENTSKLFIIAVKIAVPIVLIIIITDLVMGLVSRSVPSLNIMILGIPVKIVVGLSAFILGLPVLISTLEGVFNQIPNLIKGLYKILPAIIIVFSDDKTEEATPKKKSEARKKGQTAKSKDVALALTLMAITLIFSILTPYMSGEFKTNLTYFLSNSFNVEIDYLILRQKLLQAIIAFSKIYLPIAVPIMAMGIVANFMQTGFMLTTEPLKPSLSKLNPLSGFKRMFSPRTLVDTMKSMVIVTILGFVGYGFVRDNYKKIILTSGKSIEGVLPFAMSLVTSIFFKITLIISVIALADFIYQLKMYNKELRMSKQEIKEEFKQAEGDPHVKGQIKQRQREIASRRMMQAVPDATVVITNPTHIAIALKYEEGQNEAPKVIAKGSENIAIKIKEIAKENDIPIIENKPLARLMYEHVELDREIPDTMYQGVAEVLALVYKLKNKARR